MNSENYTASPGHGEDMFAWLEDVEGTDALTWVHERNAAAEGHLHTDRKTMLEQEILEVLDSDARIPYATLRGEFLYNFWTDEANPRGLWRRTTLDSYRTENPEWDVLLDVDALGKAEDVNWVWHGATVLYPSRTRALISLSRGGSDADVTREFDMESRSFVDGAAFTRAESKGGMNWADTTGEAALIYTDFGEGTMTLSGYPRTVRRWKRGTPLESAEVLYEGQEADLQIGAAFDPTPGFERTFVYRAIAFYNTELFELREGGLVQIDVPNSAEASVWRDWLLVHLRDSWEVGGETYLAGSLIAGRYEDFLAGSRDFTILFAPTPSTSLAALTVTRSHVVITLLEDVVNRLEVLTPPAADSDDDGDWHRQELDVAALAGGSHDRFATVSVTPVDAKESDDLWANTQSYLAPARLSLLSLSAGGSATGLEPLKSLPHFFDAEGMEVTQHFATSHDGTKVPYFQVSPAARGGQGGGGDVGKHTPKPTLLYGYGGFEISLLPAYNATMARAWLARGGTYVVANIRGGGEYGPAWHQAALQSKRHRAYEDFVAVARDLITRGVTTREQLGAQGGSNGGLLMGNMLTQYPEDFGAIVCQVPLLDMKRYTHLLAGHSWIAEYGDPDDPAQWEFIRQFSPYHLAAAGRTYPPVLFTTSTRDDRVHPGHARKMAAKLASLGQDVTYWENVEGGHGGAATNAQRAHMQALAFEFLWQRLS